MNIPNRITFQAIWESITWTQNTNIFAANAAPRLDFQPVSSENFGLVRECASQDTIIVPINPVERKGTPRAASEILNRLNEVAFNAVLLKELRMIALLRQVANPSNEEGEKWAKMRVHSVTNDITTELNASSKLIAEWDFFRLLREEGRRSAHAFLESHTEDLGRRSTLDLDVLLEGV